MHRSADAFLRSRCLTTRSCRIHSLFLNGTRMTTKAEWACRRAEIATLAQEFEYGYKPNPPTSATTGSRSGNTLTVTVNDNGRTMSFNASITYPSTGTAPYPAIIGVGASSLNNSALSSMGVAVINLPNDQIAPAERARIAWSRQVLRHVWQRSFRRRADGLGLGRESPDRRPGENSGRQYRSRPGLGVTGCSRNGKGALAVGAFDERIKLTIPQEPGSGGSGTWRVSNRMLSQGQSTQTLCQIVGENVWFRSNFSQFGSTVTQTTVRPSLHRGPGGASRAAGHREQHPVAGSAELLDAARTRRAGSWTRSASPTGWATR